MLMARLGVKDFVISGSERSIGAVDQRLAQTKESLQQSKVEISAPKRAAEIAQKCLNRLATTKKVSPMP